MATPKASIKTIEDARDYVEQYRQQIVTVAQNPDNRFPESSVFARDIMSWSIIDTRGCDPKVPVQLLHAVRGYLEQRALNR